MDLSNCPYITPKGLAYVSNFAHLEILCLSNSKFETFECIDFKKLKNLKALVLENCKITDAGLKTLSEAKVSILILNDCQNIKGSGLKYIAQNNLQYLRLNHVPLNSGSLKHLSNTKLIELFIGGCKNLTDDDLLSIHKLPLVVLVIYNNQHFTDLGFSLLRGLPLRYLSVGGTNFSDKALKKIYNLKLTNLSISNCKQITDKGFKYINRDSIEWLTISDNPQLSVNALSRFKDIQFDHLDIQGIKISKAEAIALKKTPIYPFIRAEVIRQIVNNQFMQRLVNNFEIDVSSISDIESLVLDYV